jgi:hypothetical protein
MFIRKWFGDGVYDRALMSRLWPTTSPLQLLRELSIQCASTVV